MKRFVIMVVAGTVIAMYTLLFALLAAAARGDD